MEKPVLKELLVGNSEEMSKEIKETARYYGAYTVGITLLNENWIYSKDMENNPIPNWEVYTVILFQTLFRKMRK